MIFQSSMFGGICIFSKNFHTNTLMMIPLWLVLFRCWVEISCQLTWGPQLALSSCWAFCAITVHTLWTHTVSSARSATNGNAPVVPVSAPPSWIYKHVQGSLCLVSCWILSTSFPPEAKSTLKWLSFIFISASLEGSGPSASTACWSPAERRQAKAHR